MSKIDTIPKYQAATRRIAVNWGYRGIPDHLWFRGQANSHWPLLPGAYRTMAVPSRERELLREFKLRAHSRVQPHPASDLEWLFVMQHHGAPTRLLDWTAIDLIALFFAVADEQVRSDAAVWVFDPWSLNTLCLEQRTVPVATDPRLREWVIDPAPELVMRRVSAGLPVAVRPPHGTDRIAAQRGVFTLHGSERRRLDQIPGVRAIELIIDRHAKAALKHDLHISGISAGAIVPGLDGLARDLAYQYGRRFRKGVSSRSSRSFTSKRRVGSRRRPISEPVSTERH